MARGVKRYQITDLSGGINQFEELARKNQVAEASNLWAPDGQAETRPGFAPFGHVNEQDVDVGIALFTVYDSDGETVATVVTNNSAQDLYQITGDFIYIKLLGQDQVVANFGDRFATANTPHSALTDSCGWSTNQFEFWDGTSWVMVSPQSSLVSGGDRYDMFIDWTRWVQGSEALPADTGFWIRYKFKGPFLMKSNGAGSEVEASFNTTNANDLRKMVGFEQAVYKSGANFLAVINDDGAEGLSWIKNCESNDYKLEIVSNPVASVIPPQLAVIPEFNTAFLAYDGHVYECPFNSTPVVAEIEQRDEIVYKVAGVKSPYYDGRDGDVVSAPNAPGYVPQLNSFPAADFVLYHQGQLFLAERGKATLRWSAPAQDGAYKVFPAYAFENISSNEDNSGITGLAAFQENVVVFQENAIWLATYSGLNYLNLPMYKLQRVVSGTGCIAHDAISYMNDGRLVFPAKDGIYAFNGASVEKLSREIDNEWNEINISRIAAMSGTFWKNKNVYLIGVPVDGSVINNRILAYDTKRNAWWFWNDGVCQTLNKIFDNNANEMILASVYLFGVFSLSPNSVDNLGAAIHCRLKTWRMGDDGMVKTYRSVRVNADQLINEVDVAVEVGDEDPVDYTMDFTSEAEAKFGEAILGDATFGISRRRERRLDIRRTGRWLRIAVDTFFGAPTRLWSIASEAIIEGLR